MLDGDGGDFTAATVVVAGGVHLWPCSDRLADLTFQLASARDGDRRLAQLLTKVSDHYDFALIDSPPGIGFLSGLALVTARWVLIPIEPADLDVMSAAKLDRALVRLRADIYQLNPGDARPDSRRDSRTNRTGQADLNAPARDCCLPWRLSHKPPARPLDRF